MTHARAIGGGLVALLVVLGGPARTARAEVPKPESPPTPTVGPPPPPASALPPKPAPAPPPPPPAVAPPRSAETPGPPPPPPPSEPPLAPRPPPELAQLKPLDGNWRCEGKMPAGPFGPEQTYKAALRVKKDLDDFWYAFDYEQKAAKHRPTPPFKARGLLGYDAAGKKLVSSGADNMGGWQSATSPGWQGDRLVLSGELSLGGQRLPFRHTFAKKGEREILSTRELKMGKDWITLGTDTCRR